MKIAVTSQNRKTITGHAGRCRKFWLYELVGQQITHRELVELAPELSFHEVAHANPPQPTHPLDGINLLIAGGLGMGLQNRLKNKGIQALATSETDPDQAVALWLAGRLPEIAAESHAGGHHHDDDSAHDEPDQARAASPNARPHAPAAFIVGTPLGRFKPLTSHGADPT